MTRRLFRVVALALSLWLPAAGQGAEAETSALLDELSGRLHTRQSLAGEFRQSKHLPFLEQPFVSEGDFTLDPERGLNWQVREPMPSLMQVRGSRVTLDGRAVRDHGMGQLISRIMLGFMHGDLSGLETYFAVRGDLEPTPWKLQLQPRGRLGEAVDRIELRGDTYLQRIEIIEREGTATAIEFSHVRPARAPAD